MGLSNAQLILGSVKKWEGIVKRTDIDHGTLNCPLCQRYNYSRATTGESRCKGCPVYKKVGADGCLFTPYEEWEDHFSKDHNEHSVPRFLHEDCKTCLKLARKELRFLKSLLPKGVK